MRPSLPIVLPVLLAVAVLVPLTLGQTGENFTQVLRDIINIDKRVRPVRNLSTVTKVSVSFHLMSLISFDTVEQKLISNGWLDVQWENQYTVWEPLKYGNVYLVSPDPNTVWRPMLTVLNTMKDLKPIGEEYITLITIFNGETHWYPAERFETFCRVDVTYFPFDIQKCRWTLFIWGGDSGNIRLETMNDTIDVRSFVVNGEWDLRHTRASTEPEEIDGNVYTNLQFEVTIRRRPSLLALTVLLPVVVLALVNVFVFTIPSEAGERLAYSMTALLSFGVFMSFIMDSMPSSTETLSIVAVNMSSLLVISALYVLLCVLSLRLFHRDDRKHPVPASLQSLIVWLEVLVCLDPPSTNKVADIVHMPTPLMTIDVAEGQQGWDQQGGVGTKGGVAGPREVKLTKLDKWARNRSRNHAAYTDPNEMTWRRVSRSLDKLLFRFFFTLTLLSNVAVWTVLVINYHG